MRKNFINEKYKVDFTEFSKKNFIKKFQKKYGKSWEPTEQSIQETLERIANLSGTNYISYICKTNRDTFLVKFEFKVAKTKTSAKKSGNRCILEVCNDKLKINILLVYCKSDISRRDGQETLWWKELVSSEFDLTCCK